MNLNRDGVEQWFFADTEYEFAVQVYAGGTIDEASDASAVVSGRTCARAFSYRHPKKESRCK